MWEWDNTYMGTVMGRQESEKIKDEKRVKTYLFRIQFHSPKVDAVEEVPELVYKTVKIGEQCSLTLDHVPGETGTSWRIYFTVVWITVLVIFFIAAIIYLFVEYLSI